MLLLYLSLDTALLSLRTCSADGRFHPLLYARVLKPWTLPNNAIYEADQQHNKEDWSRRIRHPRPLNQGGVHDAESSATGVTWHALPPSMARFFLKMLSSSVADWTGALGEVIIRDPHQMSRPKDGSIISSNGRVADCIGHGAFGLYETAPLYCIKGGHEQVFVVIFMPRVRCAYKRQNAEPDVSIF
ncbi:hypothetical protein K469DRAFT_267184 [Zopfia rhizophila CBS 207.26]|uniref:Uncharacterized protein n=1 Tax=Zopfia rhizophila CBS 207.26 TaxID=1314779 RepID=A0A6A6DRL9_9PEZI|nr:hypothetical protein K469DRAFT_267184 [Zopfia rhizophila CBS 207.26]